MILNPFRCFLPRLFQISPEVSLHPTPNRPVWDNTVDLPTSEVDVPRLLCGHGAIERLSKRKAHKISHVFIDSWTFHDLSILRHMDPFSIFLPSGL